MIEVGKTYDFNCQRKGKFTGKVVSINGEFAYVEIVKGKAKAMMNYNVKEVGDEVGIRISFIISSKEVV